MILTEIIHTFKHALVISGFVFVMMLAVEYINVLTKGLWQKNVSESKFKQYFLAAVLGAIPGCLGAFTSVALFTHRIISFGALVTTMIATSGDEAFVMFAMFPKQAALLTVIIFIVGIFAGWLTDKYIKSDKLAGNISKEGFSLHGEDKCLCFNRNNLFAQWRKPSPYRILLTLILILLSAGFLSGTLAGGEKIWIKATLIISALFSLFVVISVPDHFLKEHLWKHVVKKHLPRIFFWTFGTLLFINFLMNYIDVEAWISQNMYVVLLIAILTGIIPESGPHLIFVTLFAQGTIPFSILLASSTVQDGHGMIPLLAESKKGFLVIKLINIAFGSAIGLLGLALNF
ncbi:MAG: hypothetical protein GXO50_04405 [Chlorobi bacterium]|nr:hypothetical protein [Chlorobiota bacterium]